MALTARLNLRQSQSLVMTPQLMQAIRLLQMSGMELERFIDSEIEQNPLLERGEAEPEAGAPETEASRAATDVHGEDAEPGTGPSDEPPWSSSSPAAGSTAPAGDFDDLGPDQTIAARESLAESLERQTDAAFREPTERGIALALLAGLDAAGYLRLQPAELAESLGAEPAEVERVLARCQLFEPTGIFARTLAECLALQLGERNRLDPAMQAMLDNLDLLAARDFGGLARACEVGEEDLHDMIGELRALDPKPGLAHGFEPLRVVVPDVHVRPASGGGWTIELNEAVLPRLIVNRTYYARVSDRLGNGEDRKFLTDCLQKASWLEKSLDQRARTILQVASEIVRQQDGFLVDGVSKLKPLNLRMIADAIGIHESTVSRATANKCMATPRGIFEFKYFFTSAIQATTGGEAHSSEAVKHRIRTMIQNESPDAVLSDDAIVDLLGRDGIDIARRTVAKYREMMRIGSSVERRRGHRSAAHKGSRAAGLHPALSV